MLDVQICRIKEIEDEMARTQKNKVTPLVSVHRKRQPLAQVSEVLICVVMVCCRLQSTILGN